MENALAALIDESFHDHLQLVEIEYTVRECAVLAGIPLDVRRETLALVRALIVEHGLIPGEFAAVDGGFTFVAWDVPIKCVLDRIDSEWSALGRELNLGDVVWLTRPERL